MFKANVTYINDNESSVNYKVNSWAQNVENCPSSNST